jgi:hypothetical protein
VTHHPSQSDGYAASKGVTKTEAKLVGRPEVKVGQIETETVI